MNNNLIIEQINTLLYTKTGNINSAVLRQPNFIKSDLYNSIIEATDFLPHDSSITERIYVIKNNITHRPLCPSCKKEFLTWIGYKNKPYTTTCIDSECKRLSKQWKSCAGRKREIEKYKKINFQIILEKNHELISSAELKKFCAERLTYKTPFNTSLLISHTYYLSSLIKQSYIKYDNNIKWSQLFYNFINDIKEAPRCPDCNKLLSFNNSIQGYRNCANTDCIKSIAAKIHIQKHNTKIKNFISSNGYQLLTDHGLNTDKHDIKHINCGFVFKKDLSNGRWQNNLLCPKCYPNTSNFHHEIQQFIEKELNTECKINNREIISPRELDIFIPSHNIAIECNGIYWHSESNGKDKNYHLDKYRACKDKNISLIQIWENEWNLKKDIVKSIISNKLGKSHRIFARKCKIELIKDRSIKSKFLNENHIQGNDNSQVSYGLYHNNELISIMTFGHRKIVKGNYNNWEMIRFCNKINTTIIGGASKLFAHFIKKHQPQFIITYADLRYSSGNLYRTIGLQHKHNSKPGYWYVIDGELKHRSGFMKHRLHKILSEFDSNLTEYQNMINNGYDRIWDCGHAVFMYESPK